MQIPSVIRPPRRVSREEETGEQQHHDACRSHPQAGLHDRLPEPEAGLLWHLQQLWHHDGLRHHPEPHREGGEIGEQHRDSRVGRQVDERAAVADLVDLPDQQHEHAARLLQRRQLRLNRDHQ